MADKAISDLTEALQILSSDWFVLQQGNEAKKLNGNTLKQYLSHIEINSIESVTFDTQGRCHIILTDGTEIISQPLKGRDGTDGTDGEDAPTITNIAIDANYHLIVTLSDGTSYDAGYCRGASGAGTGDMLAEVYDPENGARQVAFKDSVVPNTAYNPSAKTAEMTQEVGKDAQGKLWTNPAPQGSFLPLSGGTMAGAIAMGSNKITGLASPTNDNDAVNKLYVDGKKLNCLATIESVTFNSTLWETPDTGKTQDVTIEAPFSTQLQELPKLVYIKIKSTFGTGKTNVVADMATHIFLSKDADQSGDYPKYNAVIIRPVFARNITNEQIHTELDVYSPLPYYPGLSSGRKDRRVFSMSYVTSDSAWNYDGGVSFFWDQSTSSATTGCVGNFEYTTSGIKFYMKCFANFINYGFSVSGLAFG